MIEFIRDLINERWINVRMGGSTSQNKQTDLRIQVGVLRHMTYIKKTTSNMINAKKYTHFMKDINKKTYSMLSTKHF